MNILPISEYRKIASEIRAIPFNTLFARQVINGHIGGTVYVDDVAEPKSGYVLHPYGMSLLFGNYNNQRINDWLTSYLAESGPKDEYLQVHPDRWAGVIRQLAARNPGRIIEGERINFKFRKLRMPPENPQCRIVRTDAALFDEMNGTVIPKNFWKDGVDFVENSVGFSALVNGTLASTAFAAFIDEDSPERKFLEIGIETIPDFYGRGLAGQVCARLVSYCLENGYGPVWSCRGNNVGSRRLAESLGFEESLRLGYWAIKRTG